ncbi:hypothetical protein [Bifidobacterium myosotis]|uniref:Uncharacterized protein n=1 Tax=Bifidobacterium myosotis TaxID=1630166 RepID=A0A5M9ZGC6_9BIFI|nr:hypothetical protein [Bifidobacterium myosotis]KAA8825365.1 hypothetical protein EMO91_12430 [Bifidobacterium myosotis]
MPSARRSAAPRPYAVAFDVSPTLWMTTTGDEDPVSRKRRRGRLRAWARGVWREARAAGAPFCDRFMMLVTVGGRRESPVLAAETLKPLIDAGTDEGLWPDDDPYHRAMTCYLRDPRPMAGGRARLNIWVIPLGAADPVARLLACCPGAPAALARATFPENAWLTSNMRPSVRERKAIQGRAVEIGRAAWRASPGAPCAVVTQVRYPDSRPRYKGDPDNTAETATAMWGAGVMAGLLPASPTAFCFTLAPGESAPGTHDLDMLAFATPEGLDWPAALLGVDAEA